MKKILVNFLGRKGGTALYAYEMTKGMTENGADVYAIVSSDNDMLNKWKRLPLKKLIIIDTYKDKKDFFINSISFFLWKRFKIKNQIKNLSIDTVYVPFFHPWFRIINNMFPKAQKIITIHDPIPHSGSFFENKLIWLLQKRDLYKADEIIILTGIFKEYVIKTYNKSLEQVHIIPHGVFRYYKEIENKKRVIEYDSDKINFLFFGRIEPYKGLNILANAYRYIDRHYNNTSLTIVGNGDFTIYKDSFKNLKNFRLINRWIEDNEIEQFFSGNNIITVLPYLNATQSGVINIAMMNKSLVIATDTGGIKEQIENNNTGILIPPNDVESLINAMEYVINNRNICKSYINNASEFILNLDWKILSKRLLEIINKE